MFDISGRHALVTGGTSGIGAAIAAALAEAGCQVTAAGLPPAEGAGGPPAGVTIAVGGECEDSDGYFVRPTVLLSDDPTDEAFRDEYFGPILAVHVYDDDKWDDILGVVDAGSTYALTGAVFARDRQAVREATSGLRNAAGNFYINDKPTGAVVGQQPFGGARASGTNDKAGAAVNLLRWTSQRAVKETFVPPTEVGYAHMAEE